jgi:cardiolipin synthase
VQIAFFICSLFLGSQISETIRIVLKVISFVAILNVISKKDKGAYKTMWVLLILIFPVFGGLLYLIVNLQSSTKKFNEKVADVLLTCISFVVLVPITWFSINAFLENYNDFYYLVVSALMLLTIILKK